MMDDSLLNPRERCLSDIGVAIEELLDGWRLHKLNIDFLLDPKSALLRLSAWTLQQLEELLGLLKYLTKDPDASRQLSELIGEIITPSRSPRSIEVDIQVNLQRSLVLFRPLLCLQKFAESGSVQSIQWPRLAGDPLACPLQDFNLSMRLLNSLRRHEFYCLADFVNRDEANLCSLPNFGTSSITEIRGLLSTHGLSLPFTFVDGLALPPLPKPYRSSDQEAPRSGHDPTVSPLPNEHREWQMRAHKLLALPIEGSDPEYFLNELESLTLERFTSLRPQLEEIYQLRNLLRSIDDCFHILAERHKADPLIVDVIQIQLLRRYSELLADNSSTFQWLEDSRKSLLASSSGLSALLLHLNGSSMQEIGESMNRPVSRSGVRQMFNRILDSLNIKLKDLAQRCEEQIARRNSCFRNALLGRWIEKHGRLPFHTDESLANEIPFSCEQETLVEVSLLSLSRRLTIYADMSVPVPAVEWDLHFRVLTNDEDYAGTGYWHDFETLRQFLPRFAVLLGAPNEMPKQEQLPGSVKSAVQRHGRQAGVARALGLVYQGQLTGDHGRAYWTPLRLEKLLDQTAIFCELKHLAMPSRKQIREFLESGVVAEYDDKHPQAIFSALTRQSTLSWTQVAERFGRD